MAFMASFDITACPTDLLARRRVGEINRELWLKTREIFSGVLTTIKRRNITSEKPRILPSGTALALKSSDLSFPI
jgi:hypothetical protein